MGDIKIINGEITSISQGIEFNDTTNTASGTDSVAFGNNTTASGNYSHAEGYNTTASGLHSYAGGALTIASGFAAHAEGYSTTASGNYAFVFGNNNNLLGAEQSSILGGLDNIMISTATINSSIIGGASNQVINNCDNTSIVGGNTNKITNSWTSSIVGGWFNTISGSSVNPMDGISIIGGASNIISGNTTSNSLDYSTIVGGSDNKIKTTTTATGARNTIIGGSGCTINGVNNSAIINGRNITLTENNTTYIGGIKRGGYVLSTTLTSALSNSSNVSYSNIGSFNAVANGIYKLRLIGTFQTAATTTGIKVRLAGTAVANVAGYIEGAVSGYSAASGLRFPFSTMSSELITTSVSTINTPHSIEGDIIIRCTVAGTVILQMASEVNGSTAQLNIGTTMLVERIN